MTIDELAKQDPRELVDTDPRDIQVLLGEVLEDDSIPYNTEGQEQDPVTEKRKEDAHIDCDR